MDYGVAPCTFSHCPSGDDFGANSSHACGESLGLLFVSMQSNGLELDSSHSAVQLFGLIIWISVISRLTIILM